MWLWLCLQSSGSSGDGPHVRGLPSDDLRRRADASHGGRLGWVHQNQSQTQVGATRRPAWNHQSDCKGDSDACSPVPSAWSGTTWERSLRALQPWPARAKEDALPLRSLRASLSSPSAQPWRSSSRCLTEWVCVCVREWKQWCLSAGNVW